MQITPHGLDERARVSFSALPASSPSKAGWWLRTSSGLIPGSAVTGLTLRLALRAPRWLRGLTDSGTAGVRVQIKMCGSWLCGTPSARVAGVYLLERLFAFLIPAGALPPHPATGAHHRWRVWGWCLWDGLYDVRRSFFLMSWFVFTWKLL